ncbi:hypothetical protein GGR54DRAFT_412120 [Hypoxylon sp. NC1633]|nr:hypothetical protein GGR54DRAFT_412120 [Hypoxylon sp. NC1633]
MAAESSTGRSSRQGSALSDLSTPNFCRGLKTDLLEALQSIKSFGSFAASGNIPDVRFEDPIMQVEDVGTIQLPLSEEQAQQLIAKSRQAPFGKGTETIVDTSVRNTWELDASMIKFKNPEWGSLLKEIRRAAQKRLGVKSEIKAEFYKMLIYEAGAMFKAHTDSIKAPGMFGTLVVCLPSDHEGGEIVVKHASQTKTFDFSKKEHSFASWYSDVSHEVLPVKSGYRWVLTYNLTLPPENARPTAALTHEETRKIRHTIQRWLAHADDDDMGGDAANPQHSRDPDADSEYFYYGLEHEYTEEEVSLAAMKSVDRIRVQTLSEISKSMPVDVFLAVLEKEELNEVYEDFYDRWNDYYDDGYPEDSEDDEYGSGNGRRATPERTGHIKTQYRVKKLVDLAGNQLLSDVDMQEEWLLQTDFFGDDPEDVEESGFTGNEGATETNWYRRAAVAIVRRHVATDFLLDSVTTGKIVNLNMRSVVSYFARNALDPTSRSKGLEALKESLSYRLDGKSTGTVLSTMIELEEWKTYQDLASRLLKRRSEDSVDPTFFEWVHRHIENKPSSFDKIKDGLASCVLSNLRPTIQLSSLMSIASTTQAPLSDSIQHWARAVLRQILHNANLKTLSEDNGRYLARCVAAYCHSDDAFLNQSTIPLVKSKPAETAFAIGFLNELSHHMKTGWPSPATILDEWKSIASQVITALNIGLLYNPDDPPPPPPPPPPKPSKYSHLWGNLHNIHKPPPKDTSQAISPSTLAEFVGLLGKLDMGDDLIQSLCSRFEPTKTVWISVDKFHGLWIPFLQALVPVLKAQSIPLSTPVFQRMSSIILASYLTVFVGAQPLDDTTLVRRTVSCPGACFDCDSLNAFLRDGGQRVARFAMNEKQRGHLSSQLSSSGSSISTSIERRGTPHTLVVMKTFADNDKERREWTSRKAKAESTFKTFNQAKLKMLLGDSYRNIRNFGVLQLMAPPVAGVKRTAAEADIVARQVPGVRRKVAEADIIDLTGDD